MNGRALITMDDLEIGVPLNAALEAAGLTTAMVSSLGDLASAARRADPDVVILTGALHEHTARELVGLARERGAVTLGLLESAEQEPIHGASGCSQRRVRRTVWRQRRIWRAKSVLK